MSRCPKCNSYLSSSKSNFCSVCGHKLRDVIIEEKNGFLTQNDNGIVSLIRYTGYETNLIIPSYVNIISRESFYDNKAIEIVDIGDGVIIIEQGAFDCQNLRKIRIRRQFKSCKDSIWNASKLEGVFYDGTLDDWLELNYKPSKAYPVLFKSLGGEYLFGSERYEALTRIDLSQYHKDLLPDKFVGFDKLESFVFPKTTKVIKHGTFFHCKNLKNIVFPDYLEAIEYRAFFGCDSLESIHLPNSLKLIDDAFSFCGNLKTVYFKGTPKEWNKIKNKSEEIKNCRIVYQN